MDDADFMLEAIKDAKSSGFRFGAVIVKDGKIIAKAGKRPRSDLRYHAESQAILNAGKDLSGCTLYATCEPCTMCFYLAWATKISKIIYGATIKDAMEIFGPEIDISIKELNQKGGNKIELKEGLMRDECLKLLKESD